MQLVTKISGFSVILITVGIAAASNLINKKSIIDVAIVMRIAYNLTESNRGQR